MSLKRYVVQRIPVSEDHSGRTWKPEDKCPDPAMDVILNILFDRGRSYQADLVEEVAERMNVKKGTAAAYVSGALLAFREAGWVECVEKDGHRPVWDLAKAAL